MGCKTHSAVSKLFEDKYTLLQSILNALLISSIFELLTIILQFGLFIIFLKLHFSWDFSTFERAKVINFEKQAIPNTL